MKNVQISQELFMKLFRYHLLDDDSCADDVKKGLEQKMNTMVERELYTKSKNAPTEEVLSGKLNDVPSVRLFHADFGTGQACPSY